MTALSSIIRSNPFWWLGRATGAYATFQLLQKKVYLWRDWTNFQNLSNLLSQWRKSRGGSRTAPNYELGERSEVVTTTARQNFPVTRFKLVIPYSASGASRSAIGNDKLMGYLCRAVRRTLQRYIQKPYYELRKKERKGNFEWRWSKS